MMGKPIRVLLADDHPIIRAGLRRTLEVEPDIVVVGEASNGDETRLLCESLRPSVVVLDLNMPGPPAVETLRAIRIVYPKICVLMLTAYDDNAYVRGLVQAGAMGYVLKDEAPEALVQAVRSVAQGGTWFSKPVVAHLLQAETPNQADEPQLTERERQIMRLVAQGWDNARIAEDLYLSEQTVRNYVSRLYGKIGVQTRAEAVIWAREHEKVE